MYPEYFGLSEPSFSITPDPHYLFLSQRHREALAHLLYGTGESGGFVQLTGEVGTGKTTICRAFLEQVPDKIDIALILNPALSKIELLQNICEEFGITLDPARNSTKELVDQLNTYLLEAHSDGRRAVLIIDEAQNLKRDVLEQIRLLTNLETAKHKLLQIFLIGQPELRDMLMRDDLRQLAQRITARYHLTPLSQQETNDYIQHRLAVAGVKRKLFSDGAVKKIYKLSGGVPRLINILCDRSLLGTYANHKHQANRHIVRKAATELQMQQPGILKSGWLLRGLIILLLLVATIALIQFGTELFESPPPEREKLTRKIIRPIQSGPPPVATAETPEIIGGIEHPPTTFDISNLAFNNQQAQQDLLALWRPDVQLQENTDYCKQVVALNLYCRKIRGTWNKLQQLNRPALVQLRYPTGEDKWVLVTGINRETLQIRTSDGNTSVPRAALDSYWYGDFMILWQPPEGGNIVIGSQSHGEVVRWLRGQLEQVQGVTLPTTNPDIYDKNLLDTVQAFQTSQGLSNDGIVGPETYLYLTRQISGSDEPRLRSDY